MRQVFSSLHVRAEPLSEQSLEISTFSGAATGPSLHAGPSDLPALSLSAAERVLTPHVAQAIQSGLPCNRSSFLRSRWRRLGRKEEERSLNTNTPSLTLEQKPTAALFKRLFSCGGWKSPAKGVEGNPSQDGRTRSDTLVGNESREGAATLLALSRVPEDLMEQVLRIATSTAVMWPGATASDVQAAASIPCVSVIDLGGHTLRGESVALTRPGTAIMNGKLCLTGEQVSRATTECCYFSLECQFQVWLCRFCLQAL